MSATNCTAPHRTATPAANGTERSSRPDGPAGNPPDTYSPASAPRHRVCVKNCNKM